jgi:hypothetical protein
MILAALAALALSDQPIATAGRDQGHVSAPAVAEETTAPSITAPRAMTTDQQIAAWIGASPAAPMQAGDGPLDYDAPFETERRIRGQVSAAIGSHGYQAFGVDVSVPLGENGFASLHYSESRGGIPTYSPYYDPRQGGYGLRSGSYFGTPEPWGAYGVDARPGRAMRTRGVTALPGDQDW